MARKLQISITVPQEQNTAFATMCKNIGISKSAAMSFVMELIGQAERTTLSGSERILVIKLREALERLPD